MDTAVALTLTRQTSLADAMAIVANNLANSRTVGFQRDEALFAAHLDRPGSAPFSARSVRPVSYPLPAGLIRDHSQGAVEKTDSPFDIALGAEAWLVVETPDGPRYSRAGALLRNEAGELAALDGAPLQGEDGGTLIVPDDQPQIVIAADGAVSTPQAQIGRLKIVRFDNLADLRKDGAGRYRSDAQPQPHPDPRIVQGALERSNVEPVREIAAMIEISRRYASAAKLVAQMHDQRMEAIKRFATLA